MKKTLLAGISLLALVGAAQAETITGQYTTSISSGADATLTDNFGTHISGSNPSAYSFSINTETGPTFTDTLFVTANPNTPCSACAGLTKTGTITVTFSNLNVGGTALTGTYTATGNYSATYNSTGTDGTDFVDWVGAGTMAGIPGSQTDAHPLVLALAVGNAYIDLVDGSDWDVQTHVLATLDAATPIPGAIWMFGGGLGLLGMLKRRKQKQSVSTLAA